MLRIGKVRGLQVGNVKRNGLIGLFEDANKSNVNSRAAYALIILWT